jgi:hypothetical protein
VLIGDGPAPSGLDAIPMTSIRDMLLAAMGLGE